jgi:hypothetical protein
VATDSERFPARSGSPRLAEPSEHRGHPRP